jgi:hypothetical protein
MEMLTKHLHFGSIRDWWISAEPVVGRDVHGYEELNACSTFVGMGCWGSSRKAGDVADVEKED